MLISNAIGKNRIDNISSSNSLLRSDGFRKLLTGYSVNKAKAEQPQSNKLHTSSGFRRLTKQYKFHADSDLHMNCSNQLVQNPRTMTATKSMTRKGQTQPQGQMDVHISSLKSTPNFNVVGSIQGNNDKKIVGFLKMEQQEQVCWKNLCKILNV